MLKMYYKNTEDIIYDVAFERLSDNEVRLTGEFPVKSDGFYLTRENENDKWDYSSFTHVKEQSGNSAIFSDVE